MAINKGADNPVVWNAAWDMVNATARPVPPPEPELPPAPPPEKPKTFEERIAALPARARAEILARLKEMQRRLSEPQTLYEPMAHQLAFHQSKARVRLIGGGNRGGKTLMGMMEVGWIIRGNHPYHRYPGSGWIYMVGRDEKHIADVLGNVLFEPGGGDGNWRRIRDLGTRKWRAYRPWEDQWRVDEAEPMPPIIPKYLIKGRPAYADKARGVVEQVKLTTGWTLKFFTGGSDPPQGSSPDYVHLDEEITNRRWLTEMLMRVTSKEGRVTWAATAEIGGEALWNLHIMCLADLEKPPEQRLFEEITATAMVNSHLSQKQVQEMQELLAVDPLQYNTKVLGHYAVEGYRIYPQFNAKIHEIDGFTIPDTWCRYMVLDPAPVVTAVLFFAVPPPDDKDHRGHVYVYGELYLQDTTAQLFGKAVADAVDTQVFEDFIVDFCGSRRTEMSGDTIKKQLEDALAANRVRCLKRGSRLLNSESDVDAGILRTKGWLLPAPDGRPRLMIFKGMAPKLVLELQRYHYGKDTKTGLSTGKPVQTGIHCCDVLRYGAMHGLQYFKPRSQSKVKSKAVQFMEERKKKKNKDKKVWLTGSPNS